MLAVTFVFLGQDQNATEAFLATDEGIVPWVDKYPRSRETVSKMDYEMGQNSARLFLSEKMVDLITMLMKMSSLGQNINYEAYSYALPKVDFSKLKL
ncbi:hypothetical protein MLD38_026782 [Melastoma candidum]|uniref:Uncharacterized protein n=1 Tax=Melastoma candidum TaxID=119954 RepID=A0ACB9P600_9MYRT|nr:hypothetical protein MLD38_026782 [Melastoma candidum]